MEQERTKYVELEKERDVLRHLLESERREYYNTFNELLSDCKALAQQLVQHSTRHEKHQKEVDKEKQKNKVLSELMVEETKKFKEKLSQYEEEVSDFHVLEQKRVDLEEKLVHSEKQLKDTFHLLNEERQKNLKLVWDMNQLRKQFDDVGNHDDGAEDVLLRQDKIEIPIREARTSTIQLSIQDRDSPEPNTVLPPAVPVNAAKVATVQKSSSVRQTKGYPSPQAKPGVVILANSHTPRVSSSFTENQKRHSYEEKRIPSHTAYNDTNDERSSKRNSLEGGGGYEGGYDGGGIGSNASPATKHKHSSYEEVRNVGASSNLTPKRNSYEGDNKKVPPPAPPRRGSTLTPQDRPPIVKIPQQLQPRKSNVMHSSDAYKQNRMTTTTGEYFSVSFFDYSFSNNFVITCSHVLNEYCVHLQL